VALLLPTPTNLRLPPGSQSYRVESDLYDICDRIRELHPALFIVLHQVPDREPYFTVMEACSDGVDRVTIPRVDELDGRVLERIRYFLNVPIERRIAEFDREEAAAKASEKERELDELHENLGLPMQHQMKRDGFSDPGGLSVSKAGVATHGRARR
jgi:hypothetical protein